MLLYIARAGPPGVLAREDGACPLRQLQKMCDVSVPTAQAACRASPSAECEVRHKLGFEEPIIFWTPREAPLLCADRSACNFWVNHPFVQKRTLATCAKVPTALGGTDLFSRQPSALKGVKVGHTTIGDGARR
jgi:hypothetical protein